MKLKSIVHVLDAEEVIVFFTGDSVFVRVPGDRAAAELEPFFEHEVEAISPDREAIEIRLKGDGAKMFVKKGLVEDETVVEQGIGYKIYYSDGRYFLDTHGPIICGYNTLFAAREAAYYAGKRDTK